jgi:hypothetical protein
VITLSSEIPVTTRVRKESVKVCTPDSPASTDDSRLDLATPDVFPHGACAEVQYLSRFAQCEQVISDRWHLVFPFPLCHFRFSRGS